MKTKRWLEFLVAGIAIITLVMLLTSITGAAPAKEAKIGIVDMEKLQKELPDYQDLQSMIKEKESGFKNYQGYLLSQHRQALKELQDQADKDKKGKSSEAQATVEKKFQEQVKKQAEETNAKLEKERDKIMKELNERKQKADENTKKLISDVAADKKLSIVFDKNAVLFGGTDITDQVIAKAKKNTADENQKDAKAKKK
ncbi:MAG TPA: OmpH family outer membrane protein [Bacillota bacterium]